MFKKRVIIPFFLLFVVAFSVFPVFSASTPGDTGYLFTVFDSITRNSIKSTNCSFSDFNKANGVITLKVSPISTNWALWIPVGNTPYAGYDNITDSAFAVYSPYNITVSGSTDVYIAPGLMYSNSDRSNFIIFSQGDNSQTVAPFWRCDIPAVGGGNKQFFNYYYVVYGNSLNTLNISVSFDNYKLSAMIKHYEMAISEDQRAFMALYCQQISNYRSNWTTGDVSGIVDDLGDISTAISNTDLDGGKSAFAGLQQGVSVLDNGLNGPGGVVDQLNNVKQGYTNSINSVTSKAIGVVPFLTVLGNFISNNWLLTSLIGVSVALFIAGFIITMLRRDK